MIKINKFGELEGSVCPECGDPIKPEWKACPHCGTRLSLGSATCSGCGSLLKPGWKACPECGRKIAGKGLRQASRSAGEDILKRGTRIPLSTVQNLTAKVKHKQSKFRYMEAVFFFLFFTVITLVIVLLKKQANDEQGLLGPRVLSFLVVGVPLIIAVHKYNQLFGLCLTLLPAGILVLSWLVSGWFFLALPMTSALLLLPEKWKTDTFEDVT